MLTSDTLPGVAEQTSLRKLAGNIVSEEAARIPGRQKTEQLMQSAGISRTTLRNIRAGLPTVLPETYWAVAAALGLPTHLFDYIIDGDVQRIQHLEGLRPDLRQHVLEAMQDLTMPRGRRSTDPRRSPRRRSNGS